MRGKSKWGKGAESNESRYRKFGKKKEKEKKQLGQVSSQYNGDAHWNK